jgi:serine/threonine protein kinase
MKPDDPPVTAAPTVLQAGRQFGVYRVEALLGAGGMGQVFRAIDTRLNRPVAIKVCSSRFGERFDREVRAISAFNHPHICTLYDIGPDYLVMELIDGDTLAGRIRKGPLPIEEVLRYGAQIADALAEAHGAGIVHRDLKPGNVMITRHGVKVLDFGLAKMTAETLEPTVTQPFAVMGTPAYMAPEQIAGRDAGVRSDLFALGLVLYEMTTGALPLPGASLGSAMLGSGHVAVTPPSKVRADASPALDDLIARLLAADPLQRPASAAAVAEGLRALGAPTSQGIRRGALTGAAVIVVIAIATSWWFTRGARGPVRLEVASITSITNLPGNKLDPALSPDGSAIAFSWRGPDGKSPGIYVLDRDGAMPHRLTQSGFDDVAPAWSPNGAEIAFQRMKPTGAHELIVVRTADGSERKLRDVTQSLPLANTTRPLLTWTPDGSAIVIPTLDVDAGGRASLFRIGVHGEPPQRLFGSTGGDGDSYPAFSPDGRWLAYALAERASARMFVRRMGRDGMPDGPPQEVPGGVGTGTAPLRSPMWSPDGRRLIFAAGSRLFEWEVGGASREQWVSGDRFQALAARWTDGVLSHLVYAKTVGRRELRELRLDEEGRRAEGPPVAFMPLGSIGGPQFSRDGRWLTFSNLPGLWIAAADGSNPRVLVDLTVGSGYHFSPDSRHVAFHIVDELNAPLYVVDLDANGAATAVRRVAQTTTFGLVGASWSADGKYLYTTAINKTPQRVMRARVSDGELEDLFDGATPVVSVDGHRVFYKKGLAASPLFARSLDGDIASNPEEQLAPGCVMVFGIEPTARGVYFVACDEQASPVALRYFEFSSRRSFDLGPPPLGTQPMLTVSANGRRLVYHTTLPDNDELTRVTFRSRER